MKQPSLVSSACSGWSAGFVALFHPQRIKQPPEGAGIFGARDRRCRWSRRPRPPSSRRATAAPAVRPAAARSIRSRSQWSSARGSLPPKCLASISRQRSQPSTAGPSRKMIWPVGALGAGREIRLGAGGHRRQHILFRARDAVDLDDELARHLIEHGAEQFFLGLEVVIDRALGDARAGRRCRPSSPPQSRARQKCVLPP